MDWRKEVPTSNGVHGGSVLSGINISKLKKLYVRRLKMLEEITDNVKKFKMCAIIRKIYEFR